MINKLKEQFSQNADASVLMGTVQLLQFELAKLGKAEVQKSLGTAKVAVILPNTVASGGVANVSIKEYEQYAPKPLEKEQPTKEVKETLLVDEGSVSLVQRNGQLDMVFDPMTEIPTLSHQPKADEINESSEKSESLNDKLRQVRPELMERLKEMPVKDLRKAIGINDRFLFINDLFRGDESMYERSIKTINSFSIYAEAEYWISRELKTKLGWDKENATVVHFDQLVKRRFS